MRNGKMYLSPNKREPLHWTIEKHRSGIPNTYQITSKDMYYDWIKSSIIVKVYKRKKWYTVKTKSGSIYKLWFFREIKNLDIEELFDVN